ncbi:MAG: zinc ribbon domain-containing protein [Candidatus Heimdallarchaeota archaeon]
MTRSLNRKDSLIIGFFLFFMVFTTNISSIKIQPYMPTLVIQDNFSFKESLNMEGRGLSEQNSNINLCFTEWNITNNGTILPPDNTIFIVIILVLIVAPGSAIGAFVLYKKVSKDRRYKMQRLLEKCVDILNLNYLVVTDIKSGIVIYSQSFGEQKGDSTIISGFLQAVRAFGSEVAVDKDKTVKIKYKNSILLMTEFINVRLILNMKAEPSVDFHYAVEALAYDVYKHYGKLIDEFHGNIKDFQGIKDLIEKHLNVSFLHLYGVKSKREEEEPDTDHDPDHDPDDRANDFPNSYGYKPPPPPDDKDDPFREMFHRFDEVSKSDLRKIKDFLKGDRFPYPYVYKPPEPPDDIAPAFQAQRKVVEKEDESKAELDCPYCGNKLPKGHKYCSICGKDVF